MIVTKTMSGIALSIQQNEIGNKAVDFNASENMLGNQLIALYYQTSSIKTCELITEFMTEAGVVWLRKLLTKDTSPIASSKSEFASLDDYLGLLAANDNTHELRAS